MKKQFITYKQAKKNQIFLNQVEPYKPVTVVKKIIGSCLIGYGVLTIYLPTGSIFAIAAGCTLLSLDYKRLLKTINFFGHKFIDFLYAHRTLSLIKYAIRLRFL